jgi:hypothetical protein
MKLHGLKSVVSSRQGRIIASSRLLTCVVLGEKYNNEKGKKKKGNKASKKFLFDFACNFFPLVAYGFSDLLYGSELFRSTPGFFYFDILIFYFYFFYYFCKHQKGNNAFPNYYAFPFLKIFGDWQHFKPLASHRYLACGRALLCEKVVP